MRVVYCKALPIQLNRNNRSGGFCVLKVNAYKYAHILHIFIFFRELFIILGKCLATALPIIWKLYFSLMRTAYLQVGYFPSSASSAQSFDVREGNPCPKQQNRRWRLTKEPSGSSHTLSLFGNVFQSYDFSFIR